MWQDTMAKMLVHWTPRGQLQRIFSVLLVKLYVNNNKNILNKKKIVGIFTKSPLAKFLHEVTADITYVCITNSEQKIHLDNFLLEKWKKGKGEKDWQS